MDACNIKLENDDDVDPQTGQEDGYPTSSPHEKRRKKSSKNPEYSERRNHPPYRPQPNYAIYSTKRPT